MNRKIISVLIAASIAASALTSCGIWRDVSSDASTDGDDASADGDQPADSDTTADGDASQEQPAEQEQPSDPELSDSTDAAGSVGADQDQQSAVAPPEEDVAGDAAPTPDPDGQPVGQADADVPAESASDLEPATVEESAGQAA